jgi:PilZ domain
MGATQRIKKVETEGPAPREKLAVATPSAASSVASPCVVPPQTATAPAVRPDPSDVPRRVPSLRVTPLLAPGRPRQFVRIPTHAVGVNREQREYPRASLRLPLRLRSANGAAEDFPVTLVTRDISSTGVFFLCPKEIAAGAAIELEIVLVQRPMGRGNVVIVTQAQVQRVEPAATPGWHGIAASFTDVQFDRDDSIPSRFLLP